ncbi:MAG: hypothetical protein M1520_00970 [Candidatus Marsarchaeota archaeon]|nr:hypothetical protein [Candidatus Marsarchaeota archaeon]
MAIGNKENRMKDGNVVRLYNRKLYNEKVALGSDESEKAATYILLARGYEERLKDPLYKEYLSMNSSNSNEFVNSASSGWEKAGDYADDSAKKAFYYKRALHFASDLPDEDRKAKELRIGLKLRKSGSTTQKMEKSDTVTDINVYRKSRGEKSPEPPKIQEHRRA